MVMIYSDKPFLFHTFTKFGFLRNRNCSQSYAKPSKNPAEAGFRGINYSPRVFTIQ